VVIIAGAATTTTATDAVASAAVAAAVAAAAGLVTSAIGRCTVRKLAISALFATRASDEKWAWYLWHFGRRRR